MAQRCHSWQLWTDAIWWGMCQIEWAWIGVTWGLWGWVGAELSRSGKVTQASCDRLCSHDEGRPDVCHNVMAHQERAEEVLEMTVLQMCLRMRRIDHSLFRTENQMFCSFLFWMKSNKGRSKGQSGALDRKGGQCTLHALRVIAAAKPMDQDQWGQPWSQIVLTPEVDRATETSSPNWVELSATFPVSQAKFQASLKLPAEVTILSDNHDTCIITQQLRRLIFCMLRGVRTLSLRTLSESPLRDLRNKKIVPRVVFPNHKIQIS